MKFTNESEVLIKAQFFSENHLWSLTLKSNKTVWSHLHHPNTRQNCQAGIYIKRVTDAPKSSWPAKQATGRIGEIVFTPPSLVVSSLSGKKSLIGTNINQVK